ncbi:hypothetical protein [Chromobacterium violaceum]|uniref:hypothetical protein n=1 Tax=Chromobacterium violaceum TaxID=536 RepID=UPI001B3207B1|nr:hypothetical protein [Chromobacterium violaceum]MBP4046846.1 hypothetical protein [Chromobacterium violaceum]
MKRLGISMLLLCLAGWVQAGDNVAGVYKLSPSYVSAALELKGDHRFTFQLEGPNMKGEAAGVWRESGDKVILNSDPFHPAFSLYDSQPGDSRWRIEFVQEDGKPLPGKPSPRSQVGMNGLAAAVVCADGTAQAMGDATMEPGQWQMSWPAGCELRQVGVINAVNVFQAPVLIDAKPGMNHYRIAVNTSSLYQFSFKDHVVAVDGNHIQMKTPQSEFKLDLVKAVD